MALFWPLEGQDPRVPGDNSAAMSQSVLAGMENSAVTVLKRAIELDNESRLPDALVCYQEGIHLLMEVLKATKEEAKKVHYRKKIADYMDRAEKIKEQLNDLKESNYFCSNIFKENTTNRSKFQMMLRGFVMKNCSNHTWIHLLLRSGWKIHISGMFTRCTTS